MKKTITFRRITVQQFHDFFGLDTPGYFIAKAAEAAGELAGPIEAIEAVCLANQLYMSNLTNRMMMELAPHGRDTVEQYLLLSGSDAGRFILEILGKDRARLILRDVMRETRAEAMIGENDKVGR